MKYLMSTLLCLGVSLSGIFAQAASEPRARVDIGAGPAFIRAESDGSSGTEMGFGVTLGVLFKNGFLLRFNVAKASSTTTELGDLGFGNDILTEDDTIVAGDLTAGYLWNRKGMVRPYLRGGFAFVYLDAQLDSFVLGSIVDGSEVDQVLTYGGGVEVGEKGHMVAFDLQKMTQASFDISGLEIDESVTVLSLQYRFRF
jgi:opacity protein-like surface antigen